MSAEYELLMPFVTVASKGGPHDDDSYTAGWEMAQLDNRLAYAQFGGFDVDPCPLRRANLPQIDLIAMKHGFVAGEVIVMADDLASDVTDEWMLVSFTRPDREATLSDGSAP